MAAPSQAEARSVNARTIVELMGRYSNPNIVTRLRQVLAGQERDRPSRRPVPSLRQKQTRLTDSQRSDLVRRYQAGESSNALACEFGVDRRTATRIIRTTGADVRYRVDADVDVARELYESGLSLARVGEQLGISARTVLNRFQRDGVPTREVGTNQWSQSPSASPAPG
jgi:DNA invertase Pin-like site-specific DNA recombinase